MTLDPAACQQEVRDAFYDPAEAVVAMAARDGSVLFRPALLDAADRVCRAFESLAVDDTLAVKCPTNVPLMEAKPSGARLVISREELPVDTAGAARIQRLLFELPFAVGDVTNQAGTRFYIHLPRPSFEGVDLRAALGPIADAEPLLQLAIDDGQDEGRAVYRALALDGPSANVLVGLYDAGEDGGMKEPVHLLALERFQMRAEGLPRVSQTFTVADDLKLVRRGLHKGRPGEDIIPPKRAEVAQLMLALAMSPATAGFGPRLEARERVALLLVEAEAMDRENAARLAKRLDALLQIDNPEGARATLCAP